MQEWSAICLNLGIHVVMCMLHICAIATESSRTWLADYYYFAAAGGAKLWVRWYRLAYISCPTASAVVEKASHDDADAPVHR